MSFTAWIFRTSRSSGTLACWICLLLSALPLASMAQGPETEDVPKANTAPFRRMFVPQKELDARELDGFIPIDPLELEGLLDKQMSRSERELALADTGTLEGSRLSSSYYIAKLIGADLYSERSRLSVSRPIRSGDRLTLSPWSLAVNTKTMSSTTTGIDLSSKSTSSVATWTFDGLGLPRVPAHRSAETWDYGFDAELGRTIHWFGWSARSLQDSQPNRLRFNLDIPRCADSCLLLQLPPRAFVQDASTAVRRIERVVELKDRFYSWPEIGTDSLIGQMAVGPTTSRQSDSLWLIELSGSQSASFSISLGATEREADLSSMDPALQYSRLIRSQQLVHKIEGNEIRTNCIAEILPTDDVDTTRFRFSSGAKLSRITANREQVDWQVIDDWIQWKNPKAGPPDTLLSSPVAQDARRLATIVSIELITPMQVQQDVPLALPKVQFDRAYVMSGTSSVQAIAPWKLDSTECPTSRLVESQFSSLVEEGVNRIEYAWQASPPDFTVGMRQSNPSRKCEVLSLIRNETQGLSVNARMRFYFAEQDSNEALMEIPKDWEIRSIRSLDRNDPISVERDDKSVVSLIWNTLQKGRIADIEMVMQRAHAKDASQPSSISEANLAVPMSTLLKLPGWPVSHNIVVETSSEYELDSKTAVEKRDQNNNLPRWQNDLLASQQALLHVRRTGTIGSDLSLPKMVFVKKRIEEKIDLQTRISRSNAHSILVEHEFDIHDLADSVQELTVKLAAPNVQWWVNENNKWIVFQPATTLNGQAAQDSLQDVNATWTIDVSKSQTDFQLRATFEQEASEENDVDVPVPTIVNATMRTHVVSAIPENAFQLSSAQGVLSFSNSGNRVLDLRDKAASVALKARLTKSLPNSIMLNLEQTIDVAIDRFGDQQALCQVRSHDSALTFPITFDLEPLWHPVEVKLSKHSDSITVPYYIDGQKLIVQTPQRSAEELVPELLADLDIDEIRIHLAGPKLERTSRWLGTNVTLGFHWPTIQMGQVDTTGCSELQLRKRLWLPKGVSVDDGSPISTECNWPIGLYSQQLFQYALGKSENIDIPKLHVNPLVDESYRSLFFPASWSELWTLAIDDLNQSSETGPDVSRTEAVSIVLRRQSDWASLSIVLFGLSALLAPVWIFRSPRTALGFAFSLIVVAHLTSSLWSFISFTCLIGFALGFVLLMVYRSLTSFGSGETTRTFTNNKPWAPWNQRDLSDDGSNSKSNVRDSITKTDVSPANGNLKGIIHSVLVFLGTASAVFWSSSFLLSGRLQAQQDSTGGELSPFDVVIPTGDDGNFFGNKVYVPAGILESLQGKSPKVSSLETGTRLVSARYTLRLGIRGRTDSLVMTYEFLVGEDLSPVRLPINSDLAQAYRLTLDNIDLITGNKLRKSGTELEWIPDKPGKRTLQIATSPLLRATPAETARESGVKDASVANASQQLDVALLPVANASIEIELDSQLSLDIVSLGQVTNPAAGRYVVQLGAVDRLQCRIAALNASKGTTLTSGSSPLLDSADAPVMNTELLLFNDTLQAKTILVLPRGLTVSREIEIEADSAWFPVGKQWGDARWVDVRPGSTLARRRYVLEWNNDSSTRDTTTVLSNEKRIEVIWIPQIDTQNLNVLFAECRDRRTRLGTLKYSRSDGAKWSIDGINTWVPSISSKERLEWPELRSNPFATTLRIPLTGGFGVLKPKPISDRQQARITSKWSIDSTLETFAARIELLGGITDGGTFSVELPSGFEAIQASNRNGAVRFLESTSHGRIRLQMLVERRSLELNELSIRAQRPVALATPEHSIEPPFSREIPWLTLPPNVISDQNIELSAAENLVLKLDNIPEPFLGKGQSQPLTVLARNGVDSNGTNSPFSLYYEVTKATTIIDNALTLDANGKDVEDKPEASSTTMRVQESELDRVQPLSVARCIHYVLTKGLDKNVHREQTADEQFVLLESRYWIEGVTSRPKPIESLRWVHGNADPTTDDWNALALTVDGQRIEFRQSEGGILCEIGLSDLACEIVLLTRHRIPKSSSSKVDLAIPELADVAIDSMLFIDDDSFVSPVYNGVVQERTSTQATAPLLAEEWCRIFSDSVSRTSIQCNNAPIGSSWERWQRHWNLSAASRLIAWAESGKSEGRFGNATAYDNTIKQWHLARSMTQRTLSTPAVDLLQTRLRSQVSRLGYETIDKTEESSAARSQNLLTVATYLDRTYSAIGCVLILCCATLICSNAAKILAIRPWWKLIALAAIVWSISNAWIPTLILAIAGLVTVLDCYFMPNGRPRQNATRGLL